jgi:hypothetical protein
LASIQLRMLGEQRVLGVFNGAAAAIADLQRTLRQLMSARALYRVVPLAEARDTPLHPALMAEHFLGNFFLSFIYAQVLMFATTADDEAQSNVDRCRKAALFAMSGMLLNGEVVPDAPPLICRGDVRERLAEIALERRALAFINLACIMFKQACSLTQQAASDAQAAVDRRDKFALCDRLIDMALRCDANSTTYAVQTAASEMLAHMAAIAMPTKRHGKAPALDITAHWNDDVNKMLDVQQLLRAVPRARFCAVMLEDTDLQVIFLGDEERNRNNNNDDDNDDQK